jgi:alpha-L-rhamnosidase
MTKIFLVLSLITSTILATAQPLTKVKNDVSRVHSYISYPAKTLEGVKPEGKWIWNSDNPNPLDYHLLVRKEINLKDTPLKATVFISAHSFADVYINGKLLDRCPINCDPEYQIYENYDITKYLKQGKNVISALVYNYGIGMHHRINARAGFFLQGRIEFKNQTPIKILTDKSWKVQYASAWENSGKMRTGTGEDRPHLIGFNEKYNASLMPINWQEENFNDTLWENAKEIGIPPCEPWNNIVVVKRPPLKRAIALPQKKWQNGNFTIYDFGKEITAYPQLEIESLKTGIVLKLSTGERLNNDSTVNDIKRVDYTDEYITKKGVQTWSPSTWRGFRYFSILRNDSVQIKNISALTRGYDLIDEGSFECSDALINKIWDIGRNTIKLCAQDTYMDTPWREQTQYIAGDSRYLLKYAFYAFGESSKFLTKYNILCGAQSQRWNKEGAIRSRYPTDWLLGPNTSAYLPDYELEWLIMVGEYYQYYGDKNLVKQVYPNMIKLINYMSKFVSKDHGLIKDTPGWIVLDHPRNYPMDLKSEITAVNCLYYEALKQISFLAKSIMNDKINSKKYDNEAYLLKSNIHKWLWSNEKKLFRDSFDSDKFSQQTQVYALLYDQVDDSQKENVIKYIISKDKSSEQSFAYYVLFSLFNQEPDWALNYIRKYWGDQMNSPYFNGAWHEAWDVAHWKGEVGSTSHAWSSGPTALLPQKVLGIEPIEAGWKSFTIKPTITDLSWAKGIVPSPKGNIDIKWEKSGNEFIMDISVPDKTNAYVHVPASMNNEITINNKPVPKQYILKNIKGYAELKLPGGKYRIVSKIK